MGKGDMAFLFLQICSYASAFFKDPDNTVGINPYMPYVL